MQKKTKLLIPILIFLTAVFIFNIDFDRGISASTNKEETDKKYFIKDEGPIELAASSWLYRGPRGYRVSGLSLFEQDILTKFNIQRIIFIIFLFSGAVFLIKRAFQGLCTLLPETIYKIYFYMAMFLGGIYLALNALLLIWIPDYILLFCRFLTPNFPFAAINFLLFIFLGIIGWGLGLIDVGQWSYPGSLTYFVFLIIMDLLFILLLGRLFSRVNSLKSLSKRVIENFLLVLFILLLLMAGFLTVGLMCD